MSEKEAGVFNVSENHPPMYPIPVNGISRFLWTPIPQVNGVGLVYSRARCGLQENAGIKRGE